MAADFSQRYPALAGSARSALASLLAVDDSLGQTQLTATYGR